jgi:hypothetical protein
MRLYEIGGEFSRRLVYFQIWQGRLVDEIQPHVDAIGVVALGVQLDSIKRIEPMETQRTGELARF